MKTVLDILADPCPAPDAAEGRIKDRLFSSPMFCYKYQLHRLCNIMPKEVGTDLSGSAEGGVICYSREEAARLLFRLSGKKCKWVQRVREDFPFTEGNLTFVPFTDACLPGKRPVLFTGRVGQTVADIAREKDITIDEAARHFIETVEHEQCHFIGTFSKTKKKDGFL